MEPVLPIVPGLGFVSGSTYYVDPNGSDGWNGRDRERPKLTITSALTLAASGDTVSVGAGAYTENITVPGGVFLDAPGVALTGSVSYAEDSRVRLGTVTAANLVAFNKTGTGDGWVDVDEVVCTGTGIGFLNLTSGSDGYIECGKLTIENGFGVGNTSNAGHDHIDICGIYITGTGTALVVAAGGEIKGRTDAISDAGAGVGINVAAAGTIDVMVAQDVACATAWTVATGGAMHLGCPHITGTGALAGTATAETRGTQTGNVTITTGGAATWEHYGAVTGDLDSGNSTTITIYGDVTGNVETNTSGTIIIYGRLTGTISGTGTLRVVSDRALGMQSGLGTTYVTGDTPVAHTTAMVTPIILDGTTGVVELDLVTAAAWVAANPDIPFVRVTCISVANACTVDPNGTEVINDLGAGVAFSFGTAYDSIDLYPIAGTGWVIR